MNTLLFPIHVTHGKNTHTLEVHAQDPYQRLTIYRKSLLKHKGETKHVVCDNVLLRLFDICTTLYRESKNETADDDVDVDDDVDDNKKPEFKLHVHKKVPALKVCVRATRVHCLFPIYDKDTETQEWWKIKSVQVQRKELTFSLEFTERQSTGVSTHTLLKRVLI